MDRTAGPRGSDGPSAGPGTHTWTSDTSSARSQSELLPGAAHSLGSSVFSEAHETQPQSMESTFSKAASRHGDGSQGRDFTQFREQEMARRRRNVLKRFAASSSGDQGSNQLFFSHCWRSGDPQLQDRKLSLFSSLTKPAKEDGPGFVFWADFLDLQAEGPVPWQREIEEGIQTCSKIVCFIDREFLLSFNCLQELVHAMDFNKPIVAVMQDQGAWDLLTGMGGAERAWDMLPTNGNPLCSYEGTDIIPGKRFTLELVTEVFSTLSSINFCACRELDFANLGEDAVVGNLLKFVEKDLAYAREHAFLQDRSLQWVMKDRASSLLLNKAETVFWDEWLQVVQKAQVFPYPTKLQIEFVAASKKGVLASKRLVNLAAVLVVLMILAGGVTAGIMAVEAARQKALALDSAQAALEAKANAEAAQLLAESAKEVAEAAQLEAERQSDLAEANAAEAMMQQALAEEARLEAESREAQAAVLLLSTSREPSTGRELRAVLKAAEVALNVSELSLVHPSLHAVVKHMATQPYLFWELEGHNSIVHSLSFSPAGFHLATASEDGSVRVWPMSVSPGPLGVPMQVDPEVLSCNGERRIISVAWSPTGAHLAAGTSEGSICLWFNTLWYIIDLENEAAKWGNSAPAVLVGHSGEVNSLEFSADGSLLATSAPDSQLLVWPVSALLGNGSGVLPLALPAKGLQVSALAWSPSGLLAVANEALNLTFYSVPDSSSYSELLTLSSRHTDLISSLDFSPFGKYLASGSSDKTVLIWELSSLGLDLEHPSPNISIIQPFQTIPNLPARVKDLEWATYTTTPWDSSPSQLGVVCGNAEVLVYDWVELSDLEDRAPPNPQHTINANAGSLTSISWDPEHDRLATGTDGDMASVWQRRADLKESGPQLLSMHCAQPPGQTLSVAWTTDGSRVASGSADKSVCIWEMLPLLPGPLAFTEMALQHLPDIHVLHPHSGKVQALAWSSSGGLLVVGDTSGGVALWSRNESASGELLSYIQTRLPDGPSEVLSVAISFDENFVAGGHVDGLVGVWHIPSLSFRLLEGHQDQVRSVAWGAFGLELASGSSDKSVMVWNLLYSTDGGIYNSTAPQVLNGHSLGVHEVEFSATGHLASASDDNTLAIWHREPAPGSLWSPAGRLTGHTGNVERISWSPRGTHLASVALDATTRVWDLTHLDYGIDHSSKESANQEVWIIEGSCKWVRWLNSTTAKLGCARQSEEDGISFQHELLLVDFLQQFALLLQMTFGCLTRTDLASLGYDVLSWVLDLSSDCNSGDQLPQLFDPALDAIQAKSLESVSASALFLLAGIEY